MVGLPIVAVTCVVTFRGENLPLPYYGVNPVHRSSKFLQKISNSAYCHMVMKFNFGYPET
jgi:hypothetical protein